MHRYKYTAWTGNILYTPSVSSYILDVPSLCGDTPDMLSPWVCIILWSLLRCLTFSWIIATVYQHIFCYTIVYSVPSITDHLIWFISMVFVDHSWGICVKHLGVTHKQLFPITSWDTFHLLVIGTTFSPGASLCCLLSVFLRNSSLF